MTHHGRPLRKDRTTDPAAPGESTPRRTVPGRAGIDLGSAVPDLSGCAGRGWRWLVQRFQADRARVVYAGVPLGPERRKSEPARLAYRMATFPSAGNRRNGAGGRVAGIPPGDHPIWNQLQETGARWATLQPHLQVSRIAPPEPPGAGSSRSAAAGIFVGRSEERRVGK